MAYFDQTFVLKEEYRRSLSSLSKFANIISYINNNKNKNILIDLRQYKYINPSYAVLIAAIPYIAKETGNHSVISYLANDVNCNNFLNNSGILKHFSGKNNNNILNLNNPLDFLIVKSLDEGANVANSIIENFPVKFEDDIKNELISKIYEVFSNSFTHSGVNEVFCCGYFNQRKSLIFSIYDIGIGIPMSVNRYLKECDKNELSEENALKWAWQQGNSSLNGKLDYPRGAGFQTLESFAIENQGDILVGSNNSYCKITSKNKTFGKLSEPILGTFFSMQIRRDFSHKYSKKDNDVSCQ